MHYQLWVWETEKVEDILIPPKATMEALIEPADSVTPVPDASTESIQVTNISTEAQEDEGNAAAPSSETIVEPVAMSASLFDEQGDGEEGFLVGDSGWSCSLCTLINDNSEVTCAVCGTRRDTETAETETAGWWCPVCTLINPLSNITCSACATARPADATTTASSISAPETVAASPIVSAAVASAESGLGDDGTERRPITPVPPTAIGGGSDASNNTGKGGNGATDGGPSGSIAFDELRIVATGKLTNHARFETRLESTLLNKRIMLTPLQVHYRIAQWTKDCDDALLEYLNNPVNQQKNSDYALAFTLPKNYLAYRGAVLNRMNMLDIIIRVQLIEAFNKTLEHLLPLVDLSNDDAFSVGAMIRKSNRYLLLKLKQPLLKKTISATEVSGGGEIPVSLVLSNYKALTSREKEEKDPTTSQNCFVQAFHQLRKKDSMVYRNSNERVFTITFADESGIDAGGVFREGMSRIVEDLFSVDFNLLLLCPNGQDDVHTSMDKFVPNPKHNGPLALEMFEFIGKLMSTSIRAKLCLPFAFPPLIWKKLVGDEVTPFDLMEVDMISFRQLDEIEHCDTDVHDLVTDQEGFARRFENNLCFAYLGSDKELHELLPLGFSKEVTFENRLEYVQLVRHARLKEFDLQIEAMARGMALVIPARALLLFSAAQMEELVCGSPVINLDLWQEMTDISGVSPQTVKLFWQVMRSLTPKEHSGFIRFAWGRSRLPTRREDFSTRMRLTNGGRAAMPVSHTCFFSIELPEYRTEEEMRHGLLTAIYYGVGGILNG